MDLGERLRRLGYAPTSRLPTPEPPKGPGVEEVVHGEWRETPFGRCFVATSWHATTYRHGDVTLQRLAELPARGWRRLARSPQMGDVDLGSTVFLDTETTGLAGGTGTYVFMVGVGRYNPEGFRVEQFFMRDYSEEPAMLSALAAAIDGCSTVVSFNGKSFDWPLLETRFALARRPWRWSPRQVDLLFPARRFWKDRIGSCRLANLEERVLGVRREGDVPGWMIPSLYFDFVRQGDARPMVGVFAHNRQDVLSLLALAVRLGGHFADPVAAAVGPEDLWAAGRALEMDGEWTEASRCYEAALGGRLAPGLRQACLGRLGLLYKRAGRRAEAERVWRALAEARQGAMVPPLVELAKHLEHRMRDYEEAAALVERALALAELGVLAGGWDQRSERERRELEHRLARLRRKAAACRTGLPAPVRGTETEKGVEPEATSGEPSPPQWKEDEP